MIMYTDLAEVFIKNTYSSYLPFIEKAYLRARTNFVKPRKAPRP